MKKNLFLPKDLSGYIVKLDDIVEIYNDKCHNITKMKPIEVNASVYIDLIKIMLC